MDWRPEAIKIFSVWIIIAAHMLLDTGYIINEVTTPFFWLAGVAIVAFFACSGYTQGLKDEFNKPGSLNRTTYWKYFKTRFLRLYIGYYLALLVIFGAKLLAKYPVTFHPDDFNQPYPVTITPLSLVLDLTCMWPVFTGKSGGIWPEGWFVSVMIMFSLVYPFFRRLNSIKKNYFYLIVIVALIAKFYVLICVSPEYAYYFPFAWTAEFSLGIIIGNKTLAKGGPKPPTAPYQFTVISVGARVWPLYLFHMIAVVFMTTYALFPEFLLTVLVILLLAEIFYRILERINRKLGVNRKRARPSNEFYPKIN